LLIYIEEGVHRYPKGACLLVLFMPIDSLHRACLVRQKILLREFALDGKIPRLSLN